jgi:pilus assembly protein Flp/PilA
MAVRASARVQNLFWRLRLAGSRQEGQGMVEYALIVALISIVVIIVLVTMGSQVHNVFVNVAKALGVRCSIGQCT